VSLRPSRGKPERSSNRTLATEDELTKKQSMTRYEIVIEDAGSNLAAYVPDLPGCVATGESEDEVNCLIREAIELHPEGLEEDGLPIPQPLSRVEYVEVDS
jgi:predicted RNase H-like HicB family nuclease